MFKTYHNEYAIHRFCIIKEQEFDHKDHVQYRLSMYKLLQNDVFGSILIPSFKATGDGCVLRLEMEFIKGTQWTSFDFIDNYDLVANHMVLRESGYSFKDFSPQNFITETGTEKIYYVDIETYGPISQLECFKLLEAQCDEIKKRRRQYRLQTLDYYK